MFPYLIAHFGVGTLYTIFTILNLSHHNKYNRMVGYYSWKFPFLSLFKYEYLTFFLWELIAPIEIGRYLHKRYVKSQVLCSRCATLIKKGSKFCTSCGLEKGKVEPTPVYNLYKGVPVKNVDVNFTLEPKPTEILKIEKVVNKSKSGPVREVKVGQRWQWKNMGPVTITKVDPPDKKDRTVWADSTGLFPPGTRNIEAWLYNDFFQSCTFISDSVDEEKWVPYKEEFKHLLRVGTKLKNEETEYVIDYKYALSNSWQVRNIKTGQNFQTNFSHSKWEILISPKDEPLNETNENIVKFEDIKPYQVWVHKTDFNRKIIVVKTDRDNADRRVVRLQSVPNRYGLTYTYEKLTSDFRLTTETDYLDFVCSSNGQIKRHFPNDETKLI